MHPIFAATIESLHPAFERLLAMPPVKAGGLPRNMPISGVYLFSEGESHLYVGRSNSLRRRYGQHCRESSRDNQAVFAFLLTRESTGRMKASYKPGAGSRSGLSVEPLFAAAFLTAKKRVRAMDFRFVEEANQTRQALLELYCAIVLGTPYNDFRTH